MSNQANTRVLLTLVLALLSANTAPAESTSSSADKSQSSPGTSSINTPTQDNGNEPTMPLPNGLTPPQFVSRSQDQCDNKQAPTVTASPADLRPTSLAFTITTDGSVKDIKIAQSSGSDALDQFVIQCVTTWRYKPATRHGQPIDSSYKLQVRWNYGSAGPPASADTPVFEPKHVATERQCVAESSYAPTIWRTFAGQVATELSFTIATDGSVKDVVVTKTSGSDRLDYDASNCVAKWRFQPVMKDGQPVEYPWRTTIPWLLGRR